MARELSLAVAFTLLLSLFANASPTTQRASTDGEVYPAVNDRAKGVTVRRGSGVLLLAGCTLGRQKGPASSAPLAALQSVRSSAID